MDHGLFRGCQKSSSKQANEPAKCAKGMVQCIAATVLNNLRFYWDRVDCSISLSRQILCLQKMSCNLYDLSRDFFVFDCPIQCSTPRLNENLSQISSNRYSKCDIPQEHTSENHETRVQVYALLRLGDRDTPLIWESTYAGHTSNPHPPYWALRDLPISKYDRQEGLKARIQLQNEKEFMPGHVEVQITNLLNDGFPLRPT